MKKPPVLSTHYITDKAAVGDRCQVYTGCNEPSPNAYPTYACLCKQWVYLNGSRAAIPIKQAKTWLKSIGSTLRMRIQTNDLTEAVSGAQKICMTPSLKSREAPLNPTYPDRDPIYHFHPLPLPLTPNHALE